MRVSDHIQSERGKVHPGIVRMHLVYGGLEAGRLDMGQEWAGTNCVWPERAGRHTAEGRFGGGDGLKRREFLHLHQALQCHLHLHLHLQ